MRKDDRRGSGDQDHDRVTPNPVSIEDAYPLSPMQRGMLFNTLLDPGSGVDVEQLHGALHEVLDVRLFQRAWQSVVNRHSVLRTSLRWEGLNEPRQEVHSRVELPWEEQDWSGIAESEREERLADFLGADRCRVFDLARAPLFRLTILRYGKAEYHIIWTFHHTILDGRSLELLLREVFAFYEAFCEDRQISLPSPRPYRDYIGWLRHRDFSADVEFWRQALEGFASPTPLVFDRGPSAQRDTAPRKGIWEVRLSGEHTSALRRVAQDNKLTLNTIVQGAWAWLLSCHSGEPEVLLGVIRSTRRTALDGAEAVIGLLVNTLPLRVKVDPRMAVIPWLYQIRQQWMAMRGHEHVPLASVQASSEVPAGSPLFYSTLVFENFHLDTMLRAQGGAWSRRRFQQFSQTSYPLDVAAYDGTELCLRIDFDLSRIDPEAARGLLRQMRTQLEAIATNPGLRVGELPLLSQAERHRLMLEWNQTATQWPEAQLTLPQLFEEQVQRTANSIAVSFEDEDITYGELNRRANRLARYLRRVGVGPDVLVGICVQRSLDIVVGLLGILKAGGAYVPVDPTYPADRIAFMLADSRAPILLVQERLIPTLPFLSGTKVVSLDDPCSGISVESGDNLPHVADVTNLAYVMYTSGSTGRPKGVMIPHRGIVNHLLWMQSTFPMSEHDRILQKTEFGFDVSVWEIFAPLLVGARLVVARPGGHHDPGYLADTIARNRVTILQLVPSLLRMLLGHPEFANCSTLRHVFCGGEAMRGDLPGKFFKTLDCALHNMYGPTEVTIDSLYYSVPRNHSGHIVPVGRPVANTQAYVLDQRREPVPIGIPGELYLGGAQVGRGYYDRPDLTAESFVVDVCTNAPGARLYKTGDRVRRLSDGNIEFLGRIDEQVKIRGFRVELGEVECVLRTHPLVQECVVTLREDVPGDKRLVAYVTTTGSSAAASELRSFLKRRLPAYMVPSAIVRLDSLPLSPNGKLDRMDLPAPVAQSEPSESYVAPRTPTEEAVAAIWRQVLQHRQVGIDENFFDLGGDSLLLVQLITEINRVHKVGLGVPDLVRNPTVEQMATLIDGWRPKSARLSKVVAFRESSAGLPLYLVYAGTSEFRLAEHMGEGYSVFGIEALWPLAWRDAVARSRKSDYPSMEQLVAPYVEALKDHARSSSCAVAGLSFAGLMAFEAAHQIKKQGGTVELVILVDTPATPPNPYQLAWNIWRKDWQAPDDGPTRDSSSRSIGAHLRSSFQTSWWLLEKAASRVLSVLAPPAAESNNLSTLFDEHGMHLPWALVERVCSEIDKSYRPRPLDCRGVLFRTEGSDESRLVRGLDDSLGWRGLFTRGLEIRRIGGDHDSIFREQIPTLAKQIGDLLNREAVAQDGRASIDNSQLSKPEAESATPLHSRAGKRSALTASKASFRAIKWIAIGMTSLLPWWALHD